MINHLFKEKEKYAEALALAKDEDIGKAISTAFSSPSTTTETESAAKRWKYDSMGDIESSGTRPSTFRRSKSIKPKQRKDKSETFGKANDIVIVKKTKPDMTSEHEESRKSFKMIESFAELSKINEENNEDQITTRKVEAVKDSARREKNKIQKLPDKGGKRKIRGKPGKFLTDKSCREICDPDVCGVDRPGKDFYFNRVHHASYTGLGLLWAPPLGKGKLSSLY